MTPRLLLLTLLLAAPAAAQDAAPVISALVAGGDRPASVAALSTGVTTVEAGALLTLVGSGLPTTDGVDRELQVAGLRVTLDRSPLNVGPYHAPGSYEARVAAYERWATQGFLPALQAAFDRLRAFEVRTAFPLDPGASASSDLALDRVHQLFLARSRDLYALAKLAVPFRVPENLGPVVGLRAELEAARDHALRAAGLERP